jgi:ribonuclease HI
MADSEAEQKVGVNIYTDGGARPNPGNMGWGVHGYTYTLELGKQGSGLHGHQISDIGYIEDAKAPKTAFNKVQPLKYFDFFGSSAVPGTNNAGEVDAMYHGLLKSLDVNPHTVNVFADSEYALRGVREGLKIWKSRGWMKPDGAPIPNAHNWQNLDSIIQIYEERKIPINFSWVKGHGTNLGNNKADMLATLGVMHSAWKSVKTEYKTSEAKGYWKSEVVKHPFLSYRRMYFNSAPEYNVIGHYFMADPGTPNDSDTGKKLPDMSYAVVRLKEPDDGIETLRNTQYEISAGINSVILLLLDRLFSPTVYSMVSEYGKCATIPSERSSLSINFLDKKPLCVDVSPAGLSLRAIEASARLEELLDRYEQYKKDPTEVSGGYCDFHVSDITPVFFDKVEKVAKKSKTKSNSMDGDKPVEYSYVLKECFKPGTRECPVSVTVPYKTGAESKQATLDIILVLGGDILPRNNLKRLEALNPKISLITWRDSVQIIRYCCVIETSDGVGIWSNYHTNRVIVNQG